MCKFGKHKTPADLVNESIEPGVWRMTPAEKDSGEAQCRALWHFCSKIIAKGFLPKILFVTNVMNCKRKVQVWWMGLCSHHCLGRLGHEWPGRQPSQDLGRRSTGCLGGTVQQSCRYCRCCVVFIQCSKVMFWIAYSRWWQPLPSMIV